VLAEALARSAQTAEQDRAVTPYFIDKALTEADNPSSIGL